MNPFVAKGFSSRQKIAPVVAMVAGGALVIFFALLGHRESLVMKEARKELESAIRMIAQAPDQGDFEIQYPATSLPGEVTVMRVEGVSMVVLPPMSVDRCNIVVNAAKRMEFNAAQLRAGEYSFRLDLGKSGGRAIAAACSGGGADTVVISLSSPV